MIASNFFILLILLLCLINLKATIQLQPQLEDGVYVLNEDTLTDFV